MKFNRKASEQICGFLDKGTHVTGELEFSGTLRIDGNFHGSIATGDILVIGDLATVHADIKAGEIEVHGKIFGTIQAKRRVEIFPTGQVRGDIDAPVLVVQPGAILDGKVGMAIDGLEETTVAVRTGIQHEKNAQERV